MTGSVGCMPRSHSTCRQIIDSTVTELQPQPKFRLCLVCNARGTMTQREPSVLPPPYTDCGERTLWAQPKPEKTTALTPCPGKVLSPTQYRPWSVQIV